MENFFLSLLSAWILQKHTELCISRGAQRATLPKKTGHDNKVINKKKHSDYRPFHSKNFLQQIKQTCSVVFVISQFEK